MTQLPPFFQDRNYESTIKFQLDVMSEYGGEDVAKEISNKRNHGSVAFVVKIFAWIRFSSGFWRMREHMLRVHCNTVRIGYSRIHGTWNSMSQSKKCEVYMFVSYYPFSFFVLHLHAPVIKTKGNDLFLVGCGRACSYLGIQMAIHSH
ncbi:hypothetical protein P3X46_004276 [Hevea brasiliensis]|uniref:Uncharacterized protein n=1 Tax=Hevea brasiliensis TaxID=3981 RepID=A0ABQ9MW84_HEVBR|nr:hypothetical protein P3X46_004276 [Hevea brasiliensis]